MSSLNRFRKTHSSPHHFSYQKMTGILKGGWTSDATGGQGACMHSFPQRSSQHTLHPLPVWLSAKGKDAPGERSTGSIPKLGPHG